jgi:hypothetical protein
VAGDVTVRLLAPPFGHRVGHLGYAGAEDGRPLTHRDDPARGIRDPEWRVTCTAEAV